MDKKSVISHMTHNRRNFAQSRGLIISAPKEWYFLTAQVDLDNSDPPLIRHPGDPAGQTLGTLESLKDMLDREGWSLNDVIRVQLDVTAEATLEHFYEGDDIEWLETRGKVAGLAVVEQVLGDFFKDVVPKPVWGAVKIISSFAHPDALVEIDFWAAR